MHDYEALIRLYDIVLDRTFYLLSAITNELIDQFSFILLRETLQHVYSYPKLSVVKHEQIKLEVCDNFLCKMNGQNINIIRLINKHFSMSLGELENILDW